jgi:nitrogen regulatory protein P-II 1
MEKIEAFIRPEKLTMTKDSLEEHGCEWSISVSEIMGHGRQKGISEVWKGKKFI